MSAIFGIVNLNRAPCEQRDLERMHAALLMYGRDAGGTWRADEIGLGQCLARVTPQDAYEDQPLFSADKQIVLVSDARLDNRAELARALEISHARVLPDSALILRAFEKWNTDCARHLIGDFSFALWDAREQKLFLARAPFSGRALFYHTTPRMFAFASMPKGLHALAHIPRALDEDYLADYLARTPSAPEKTFYRNIPRLLPGHSLILRDGKIQTQTFWQLDLKRELCFTRDEEYLDAFNNVLERAVSDALASTAHVGIMVSGGLDSSSLASIAAPLLAREGKHLAGFTEVPRANFDGAVYDGRYADETPFVQALAQRHENLYLHLVRTDGHFYLENSVAFFEATEIPFRNASNRVWYEEILRQAQAQEVNVVLNGGQGNLTISWYGDGLLPQLLRAGDLPRAWREARALYRRGVTTSSMRGLIAFGVMPRLPDVLFGAVNRSRGRGNSSREAWREYSPIHPDFYCAQRVKERAREGQQKRATRTRSDLRQNRADTLVGTSAAADGFGAGYQALFGVEQRAPATDQRVVEFCFALPEDQFLRDGQRRWLIQRAMQNRLPRAILENKKRGLQAADWYERLFLHRADILQEIARLEKTDLAARAFDLQRLRALVEQMPEQVTDIGRAMRDYRGVLEIGLMTARFVRWVEEKDEG